MAVQNKWLPVSDRKCVVFSVVKCIKRRESVSDKSKCCVLFMTFRPSQRTLFMARRNWVPLALIMSSDDLLCCNCKLKSQPNMNWIPRLHQACNDSTPVHLVISTAEILGQTSCDALATAPEPHGDWGMMHPPKKALLGSRKFLVDGHLLL